jgi:Kef-type K+ transport system membrane component KefB/mannitol/fructose-specific phosphotransferase system IIA component (Ntr-type)
VEPVLHYLEEGYIWIFMIQMLALLGAARGLGALFRRAGQPALVGEILAGLLFGPTILGRLAPGVQAYLFPDDALQHGMLDTVAWIGLLLLLLSAGLEVNVSVAWRQRGEALKISLTDIALPMLIAFIPAFFLPDRYLPDPSQRLLFALFIATVMTISALPITLRALHDLDLLKTDLGLLIISALTINDIIGWAIFTIVLGMAGHAGMAVGQILLVVVGTVVFTVLCVTVGRRAVTAGIVGVQKGQAPDAGMVLTFVCCVALAAGLVTHGMGIHALFGFFLAGIMAVGTPALAERTRHVIHQMVYAVFVPIFFATIGLQLDFFANFDPLLVLLLTGVGVAGRYLGAWVGARMTPLSTEDRQTVAIAHTPGGSMEMIMAFVALQYRLITVPVFVAIVFAALVSSIAVGPWMAWSIRRRRTVSLLDLFVRRGVPLALRAGNRDEAIRELCETAAEVPDMPHADNLASAVRAREAVAGTALDFGVAVPHARIPGLAKPVIVFGRSVSGLEWDAPDGLPAHLIFLILTPAAREDLQVQILGGLARGLHREENRRRLLTAPDERQAQAVLREALRQADVAATPR